MYNQRKDSAQGTLTEAVETLSSIADLDAERQYAVTQEQELKLHGNKIQYKSVRWLGENSEESRKVIKTSLKLYCATSNDFISTNITLSKIKMRWMRLKLSWF